MKQVCHFKDNLGIYFKMAVLVAFIVVLSFL